MREKERGFWRGLGGVKQCAGLRGLGLLWCGRGESWAPEAAVVVGARLVPPLRGSAASPALLWWELAGVASAGGEREAGPPLAVAEKFGILPRKWASLFCHPAN